MSKYLYGASVQGIQEFIFATNQLREIVGASEIVKSINDDFEKKFENHQNIKILLNAAGNIKAIFENKEILQEHIKDFEKEIMQSAYGITISQSVVNIENSYTQKDIDKLEENLKTQRNKSSIPLDSSINITKLNPKTAKPVTKYITIQDKEVPIDKATQQKRAAFPKDNQFHDISKLSNAKNKIAVIHADGNRLGTIVQKLGSKLSSFSKALNDATKKAYKDAITDDMRIRKVILGGDDMSVICDADIALEFTNNFLKNFEKESAKIKELQDIGVQKLTACAGIAYANEKYPFHYAISLAESLCGVAKNHSNRENSCLMFHNIQSSNFQSWDKFIKNELTIKNDNQTIRCDFGAYYLDKKDEATIDSLINTVEAYRCDGSPISRLREWLSELYKSDKNAKNLLDRINKVTQNKENWNCKIMDKNLKFFNKHLSNDTLIIDKDGDKKTPIYDILQILSASTGQR